MIFAKDLKSKLDPKKNLYSPWLYPYTLFVKYTKYLIQSINCFFIITVYKFF